MPNNKLLQAFKEGKTQDFIESIEEISNAPVMERALEQGPLPKNDSTFLLQSMVKSLLSNNESVEFKIRNNHQLIAVYKNQEYDMNKILQEANFNQILLDKTDLDLYEKVIRENKLSFKPVKPKNAQDILAEAGIENAKWSDNQSKFIDNMDVIFNARDKQKKLINLTLAEKLALNVYSTEVYSQINQFLRGQIDNLSQEQLSSSALKEIFLAAAVGVHGLNRISDSVPISSFRVDSALPEHLIQKRMQAAENKKIILEVGFISTNMEKPAEKFVDALNQKTGDSDDEPVIAREKYPAGTVFTGLRGKDISAVSCHEGYEKEFLIPPTQLQMQSGVKAGDSYYFLATPVSSPEGLRTNEDLGLSSDDSRNSMTYSVLETAQIKSDVNHQILIETLLKNNPDPLSFTKNKPLDAVKNYNKLKDVPADDIVQYMANNLTSAKVFLKKRPKGQADLTGRNFRREIIQALSDKPVLLEKIIELGGLRREDIFQSRHFENNAVIKNIPSDLNLNQTANPNIIQTTNINPNPLTDQIIEKFSTKGLDFNMEDLDELQKLIDDKSPDKAEKIKDILIYAGNALEYNLLKNLDSMEISDINKLKNIINIINKKTGMEYCNQVNFQDIIHEKESQFSQNQKNEQVFGKLSEKYNSFKNIQDELKISHAKSGVTALEIHLDQISNLLDETEKLSKNIGKNQSLAIKIAEFKNNLEKTKNLIERKRIQLNPPSEPMPLPPILSKTEEDLYKSPFEEIISEMENMKNEKPLNAPAQSKTSTTLASLYQNNPPQINLNSNINNNYNYNEYHYTQDQKSDVVGTNNKLEVRVFNIDSYNGPRTEDFIRRAESLHKAAVSMISSENTHREKTIADLKTLLDNTKQTIQEKAAIDPQKMQASNGADYFTEKHAAALVILQQFIIDSLDASHGDEKYDLRTALISLETAESEVVAKEGRANLLHIYEVAGHTRVSLSEPQGDHTNPSTMRDKPELSNFVKVSSGYSDENGKAQIEFSAYRHSSYPPIKILGSDIEAKMARRNGAAQSVEQMIKTLSQDMLSKNPSLFDASKQPIEIKLSSMMLLTPLLKDQTFMGGESEMRQLKDSLIALNIYHNQEIKLNINGQEVVVKPILSQMNIPANNVMKVQFKKLGGEFNDNINHKGFYEFNKNFMEFIKSSEKSDTVFQNIIQPIAYMTKKDARLDSLEKELVNLQQKSNLTKLYSELGKLQNDTTNATEYKAKLLEIRAAEKKLNAVYTNIITRQKEIWKDNQTIIKSMRNNIESELIKNPENKSLQAAQLYLDSSTIYYSDAHKIAEHGHQFQTRYLLANHLMGNYVEFFCKSGEDRTGRTNNHLEEFLAFRRENGLFPRFNNAEDLEKLKPIACMVQTGSVSTEITNQNAPGAKGLQQDSSFGSNKDLQLGEFDLKNAQMAKGVYNISMLKKIKHTVQMQLTKTDFEKEFNAISSQFQHFINDKLSHFNDDNAKTKNTSTASPTLQNIELLKLEEKANQLFAELDANTKNLSDITLSVGKEVKELNQICNEIRALKTGITDEQLHREIKRVDTQIQSRLHTLTIKVTDHINEETGRSIHHATRPTISGTPSRPLQKSPPLVQNDIINTIKPVFKAPEFTMKPDNTQSIIVSKIDEEKPFITVTNKEIQSHSMKNSAGDYELMIRAATKMFDKPLLIYVPESEKRELDKAIKAVGLKDTDFEHTTNRQDYETKQKAKEQTLAQKQEIISTAASKSEYIHAAA